MGNMNVAYQRPAKSLLELQREIKVWPNGQADKGFITGYPSANFTGHNPNQAGVVMGYDIGTYIDGSINEPDGRALAEYLRTEASSKFQYLIHDMGTEAEGQRPMIAGNLTGWQRQP
ncbi:hypothetical protein [Arthrobacter sp. H14-L1]|uniref:hypothetical protein n=1 Tax=Arthrobacter sp. H14-L1 TaxID=2996697 RepID=UPI0022702CD7|nr:hypothetical protein [Arthrobacter sp. H14-L1]MCY0905468.1 hypothetical protein [Arthrobacter sp. H14-L1]